MQKLSVAHLLREWQTQITHIQGYVPSNEIRGYKQQFFILPYDLTFEVLHAYALYTKDSNESKN